MLTEPNFANFVQAYGEMVLKKDETLWPLLQRLFWFTVEFGLIRQNGALRIYGGGILSSIGETQYSIESDEPLRVDYTPLAALRTPYRIDQMQPIYYVIESFESLYRSVEEKVDQSLTDAQRLGEFPPFFKVEKDNPCIHIFAC
jgi:phenylalanine-4-hydroxylase